MHEGGAYVAMVGDSVGDLPAMHAAQLRIVLRSSSQMALNVADIVLLADSLAALPEIFRAGQRIINAVLNTLKLYLSQTAAQLLLIGAFFVLNLPHFFYGATQAGVISAYTLAIPNIVLRFWAPTGGTATTAMRRALARIVVPAMIANGIFAVVIHLIFWRPTGDAAYAQLATTYALLGAGWLLILFVVPPTRFWAVATKQVGDRRVIRLLITLAGLFFATLAVPVFRQWLQIDWLPSVTDYLVIAIALGAWTLSLHATWRVLARATGDSIRV
jgi:cation-transporting ATPase E